MASIKTRQLVTVPGYRDATTNELTAFGRIISAGNLHYPLIVSATTYTVIDGHIRLQAALKRGADLIRVTLVNDVFQAAEALRAAWGDSQRPARPMTASQMAFLLLRIVELDAPAALTRRRLAQIRHTKTRVTSRRVGGVREIMAPLLDVSTSRANDLIRLQRGVEGDNPEVSAKARQALADMDAGKIGSQAAIQQVHPRPSIRTGRQRMPTVPAITDIEGQRIAFEHLGRQANALITSLAAVLTPNPQHSVSNLTTWRDQAVSARAALHGLVRSLNLLIDEKEDGK